MLRDRDMPRRRWLATPVAGGAGGCKLRHRSLQGCREQRGATTSNEERATRREQQGPPDWRSLQRKNESLSHTVEDKWQNLSSVTNHSSNRPSNRSRPPRPSHTHPLPHTEKHSYTIRPVQHNQASDPPPPQPHPRHRKTKRANSQTNHPNTIRQVLRLGAVPNGPQSHQHHLKTNRTNSKTNHPNTIRQVLRLGPCRTAPNRTTAILRRSGQIAAEKRPNTIRHVCDWGPCRTASNLKSTRTNSEPPNHNQATELQCSWPAPPSHPPHLKTKRARHMR